MVCLGAVNLRICSCDTSRHKAESPEQLGAALVLGAVVRHDAMESTFTEHLLDGGRQAYLRVETQQ